MRALAGFEVHIHPGISSVQLAAAYACINLDESATISFHDLGDPEEKKQFMLECFRQGRHLIYPREPGLETRPDGKVADSARSAAQR
jgi:precorrin-6B methylase 1